MSNKIDGINQGPRITPGSAANGKPVDRVSGNGEARTRAPQGAGGETVELTSNARLLEQMSATLEGLELQNRRLDSIMESIANGDYEIDAEKIATRLLMLERSLGRG